MKNFGIEFSSEVTSNGVTWNPKNLSSCISAACLFFSRGLNPEDLKYLPFGEIDLRDLYDKYNN